MTIADSSTYHQALVTGASGFIGLALVKRLLAEGVAVRAVVHNPANSRLLPETEVVTGDIQDVALMRRCAHGCDVASHIAAIGTGSASIQYETNVHGAENVSRAAAEAGEDPRGRL